MFCCQRNNYWWELYCGENSRLACLETYLSHVDYVPTVFSYKSQPVSEIVARQRCMSGKNGQEKITDKYRGNHSTVQYIAHSCSILPTQKYIARGQNLTVLCCGMVYMYSAPAVPFIHPQKVIQIYGLIAKIEMRWPECFALHDSVCFLAVHVYLLFWIASLNVSSSSVCQGHPMEFICLIDDKSSEKVCHRAPSFFPQLYRQAI